MLGVMNFKSEGGPKDLAEATRIFRLAAEQGNTKAQVILGSMHYEGKGGPPDFAEARRLLGLAAAQGQAKAQAELGNMHQGPEDLAEAEPLPGFAAALGAHAAQDQAEAQCLLGEMHFEGKGGPIDLAEARRLCTLAAISINRRLTLALSLVVCLANSELSVLVCFFHRSYTLTVYGTVRCMEHI